VNPRRGTTSGRHHRRSAPARSAAHRLLGCVGRPTARLDAVGPPGAAVTPPPCRPHRHRPPVAAGERERFTVARSATPATSVNNGATTAGGPAAGSDPARRARTAMSRSLSPILTRRRANHDPPRRVGSTIDRDDRRHGPSSNGPGWPAGCGHPLVPWSRRATVGAARPAVAACHSRLAGAGHGRRAARGAGWGRRRRLLVVVGCRGHDRAAGAPGRVAVAAGARATGEAAGSCGGRRSDMPCPVDPVLSVSSCSMGPLRGPACPSRRCDAYREPTRRSVGRSSMPVRGRRRT
jgi:hypothetical protein